MKTILEYIEKNYLILVIKLLIIFSFIYSLISGISKINNHYNAVIDYTANPLEEYFSIVANNYYLRPSLILLIPIIGVFTNKKISWIFIQSYFYFLISNTVFTAIQSYLADHITLIINPIALLFLFLFIVIINKTSYHTYGIKKSELISKNIIASVIGISITVVLAMIKLN